MTDAVIVAAARTPFACSGSGALNLSHGVALAGPAVRVAVDRAGIETGEVEEVLMGCAQPEGATGAQIARQVALAAGLPAGVGGLVVSRGGASGLEAIALAAQRIAAGDAEVLVAGGVESPSCVRREANTHMLREPGLARQHPALYRSRAEAAARIVGQHGLEHEALLRYAVDSRRRCADAREAGRFADAIVPLSVTGGVVDPSGGLRTREFHLSEDELWHPGVGDVFPTVPRSTAPDPAARAAQACLPADGAAACVLMSAARAERRGLRPWGRSLGFAAAGCGPDETGLGAALAVRKLLQRLGLRVEDIGLWELHEASAAHVLLCAERLGLPRERLNVDGGALALGDPEGASGARLVAHALAEGRRRGLRRVCVAIDAGADVGVAGVFEVY